MAEAEKIAAHWDHAAGDYEKYFRAGPVADYVRAGSLRVLLKYFRTGQEVLEVGCGSGEEAAELARRGIAVLATDVSPGMLKLAQARQPASPGLKFARLAADELGSLGSRAWDGIFSSLGGMNCVEDLPRFAAAAARQIKPGGYFISSVLNRFCLFEMLFFGLRLQGRRAWRRLRPPAGTLAFAPGVEPQAWRHYSVREYFRHFQREFAWVECRALPFLLPPLSWQTSPNKSFAILAGLDKISGRLWPFYGWGDHFLLVLKRREHA